MAHGAARFVGPLLVALVVLTGCGDADGAPSATPAHDRERENTVAGDKQATAEEIIDAGGPVRVATSGDRTLVVWRAEFDDDEGPQQAAWRLSDGSGRRIADGRLGLVVEQGAIPTLTGVPDGFLVENYTGHVLRHIDLDGKIANVPTSRTRTAVKAGDVLQESLEGTGSTFYRPGERTAYRLAKLPFENPQGVVLDERGTVWVLVDWTRSRATIASSPGGTGPWQRTTVPLLRPGGTPGGLTVAAGKVLVPTQHGNGESPVLDGVWTHAVDGDPGAAWTKVSTAGVTFENTLQPQVAAFSDGRIVLTGDSGEVWVQDDSGRFRRLTLPKALAGGYVEVVGTSLYLSFTRDHQLHASDDSGKTWHVVDR